MSITAIILNYYQERQKYMMPILEALVSGSVVPDKIIVWNNDPNLPTYLGIRETPIVTVVSHENFGCKARYVAAGLAETEYVFFQDNDLKVKEDTLRDFLRRFNGGIVAGAVRYLAMDDLRPYSTGETGRHTISMRGPHVALGRIMLMRATIPTSVLDFAKKHKVPMFRTDDIVASACIRELGGKVACANMGWEDLPEEGIGLSHDIENHYWERDAVCLALKEFWR